MVFAPFEEHYALKRGLADDSGEDISVWRILIAGRPHLQR